MHIMGGLASFHMCAWERCTWGLGALHMPLPSQAPRAHRLNRMKHPQTTPLKIVSPAGDAKFSPGAISVEVRGSRNLQVGTHQWLLASIGAPMCALAINSRPPLQPFVTAPSQQTSLLATWPLQVASQGSLQRLTLYLSGSPSSPGCSVGEMRPAAGQTSFTFSLALPSGATGTLYLYAKVRAPHGYRMGQHACRGCGVEAREAAPHLRFVR